MAPRSFCEMASFASFHSSSVSPKAFDEESMASTQPASTQDEVASVMSDDDQSQADVCEFRDVDWMTSLVTVYDAVEIDAEEAFEPTYSLDMSTEDSSVYCVNTLLADYFLEEMINGKTSGLTAALARISELAESTPAIYERALVRVVEEGKMISARQILSKMLEAEIEPSVAMVYTLATISNEKQWSYFSELFQQHDSSAFAIALDSTSLLQHVVAQIFLNKADDGMKAFHTLISVKPDISCRDFNPILSALIHYGEMKSAYGVAIMMFNARMMPNPQELKGLTYALSMTGMGALANDLVARQYRFMSMI